MIVVDVSPYQWNYRYHIQCMIPVLEELLGGDRGQWCDVIIRERTYGSMFTQSTAELESCSPSHSTNVFCHDLTVPHYVRIV
jgi:hypothetical protein